MGHEGMADLMYMMNTLLAKDGTILVDNLMDDVKPVTQEEIDSYKTIDFDVHDFKNDLQTAKLISDGDKVKTLMARWRFPSLSLHGIEGAFSDTGAKTVIPRKVIGKFSIRIVPDQTPEKVEEVVIKYLNKKWAERGSSNKMKASLFHGGRCWMSDPAPLIFWGGRRATKT